MYIIPSIILLFSISVTPHCMLDMRLDYEGVIEALVDLENQASQKLNQIKQWTKQNNLYDSNFNLLEIMTKDFDYDEYIDKIKEKEKEMIYNVEFILNQYCKPISQPMDLRRKIPFEEEYELYNKSILLQDNKIIYDDSGSQNLMIKVMVFKDFVGLTSDQNLEVLKSRVATQIRAGQCLLNPLAYNVSTIKYDEIQKAITERTSAMSAVIQKKYTDQSNLDSLVAIDCNYYTPGASSEINEHTKFYLSFPQISGNLETLFFFQPEQVEKMRLVNPIYINNISLRIQMMKLLFADLDKIHKTGIIHKNIRLQNIFFHVFVPTRSDKSDGNIFLSFGDFSLSGIDDYDARFPKSFYVPDDAKTELGPRMDIYQLGIVFFQILFMIPVEKTPGMSLSKIAKLISPTGYLVKQQYGQKVLIFDQLMKDAAANNFEDVLHYDGSMTKQAALCFIGIFKRIHDYFNNRLFDSYESNHLREQERFFYFNTEDKFNYDPFTLMENESFKSHFMSIFMSLYGYVFQCYGDIFINDNILNLLRRLIHPDPNSRFTADKSTEYFESILEDLKENENRNFTYQKFDPSQFVSHNHVSVLKRRAVKRNLILL